MWQTIIEFLKSLFREKPGLERPSPQDWLPVEAITQSVDRRFINIDLQPLKDRLSLNEYPSLARDYIPNTNSMDGVFDYGNNTLPVAGATPEDHAKLVAALEVGSDAIYQKDNGDLIIHRIVKIENGLYTFQGVNNVGINDKPDVRPDQIKYISLGVIN